MSFWIFGNKKEIEKLREEVQESFNHVKRDINKVSEWIKHLDDKKQESEKGVELLTEKIKKMSAEIEDIKERVDFFGKDKGIRKNGQASTDKNKQQTNESVQTAVQTAVQTGELNKLTVMERAILWALLNAQVKMSHEDIAAMLGKDKSTIRGQINTIKQKIPEVIEEIKEPNGKKRLYISEENKKNIIKSTKIKIK